MREDVRKGVSMEVVPKDEERLRRLRALEERLCDPRSPGNVDSLLDTVAALVSDCDHPAIRRMKNVEAYTTRCKLAWLRTLVYPLLYNIVSSVSSKHQVFVQVA